MEDFGLKLLTCLGKRERIYLRFGLRAIYDRE